MADDVTIKFGADIADLKGKVDEVTGIFGKLTEKFAEMAAVVAGGEAFKEFINVANEMNAAAERMSRTLGITAAEAGDIGVAIKEVGARLGDGTASADTYTQAFIHFTRQLRTGGDAAKAMGVDVDALKNGTKTSNEVFRESLGIIARYAPGFDQNAAAMTLFGRRIGEVQLLMGLTNEQMEEAHKKAEALNLTISKEGVEAAQKYRGAMNDVKDVMEGVSKTVGEAVMPHFTELAEKLASIGPVLVEGVGAAIEVVLTLWDTLGVVVSTVIDFVKEDIALLASFFGLKFGGDMPSAMEIFKGALKVVQAIIVGFGIGFQEMANVILTAIEVLIAMTRSWGGIIISTLKFDWSGIKAAWKQGTDDVSAALQKGMDKAIEIATKGKARLDAIKNGGDSTRTPAGSSAGTGTRKFDGDKAGKDANTQAAQLSLLRAQNEAEKALQLEYLKEAQSIYDESYKNGLISTKEYFDAKLAIEIKSLDASLDAKKQELADAKAAEAKAQASAAGAKKPEERNKFEAQTLKFQTEQAKLVGQINVLEAQRVDAVRQTSDAYADVSKKVNADIQAIATARAKAAADEEIATETAALQQKKALRQISADDAFAIERQLEEKSYAAVLADLQARQAAVTGSQDEMRKQREQLQSEAEAAEAQHQAKLTQIANSAEQARAQYSLQAQQSVQSGFAKLINDTLSMQKSIGDVLRSFAASIAQTFENLIAQRFAERLFGAGSAGGKIIDTLTQPIINAIESIAVKWLGAEVAQTAATETESGARTLFRTAEITAQTDAAITAAALTAGAEKAASISGAMGWAATAAAAAMASVAAIPFYGWAMAPEVGAATYANAMGYAALASAEGGWGTVPADGALTELHKQEMVLPAFLAQGVRQMAEPGKLQSVVAGAVNQSGQPAASGDVHFHVNAIDARGVKDFFNQHGGAIVDSIKKQNRNFAFS